MVAEDPDTKKLYCKLTRMDIEDLCGVNRNCPLIDIDKITEAHEKLGYERGRRDGYAEAITEQTSAERRGSEYIQVIRCKDCKYCTEHYDIDGNVPYWTCSEWDSGTDADGFCHYATKMEAKHEAD